VHKSAIRADGLHLDGTGDGPIPLVAAGWEVSGVWLAVDAGGGMAPDQEGASMLGAAARLQKYADGLRAGLLSVPEVATAVLDTLGESADRGVLWAGAPVELRRAVLGYLAAAGLDGLPAVFTIGPSDPAWRAEQAVRRREVATELLTGAQQGAAELGR
jgi:hypothetical protein